MAPHDGVISATGKRRPSTAQRCLADILPALADGRLHPLIDRTFLLDFQRRDLYCVGRCNPQAWLCFQSKGWSSMVAGRSVL